jgi:hypothetical protein
MAGITNTTKNEEKKGKLRMVPKPAHKSTKTHGLTPGNTADVDAWMKQLTPH